MKNFKKMKAEETKITPLMYEYYGEQEILPTYAKLQSENDLIAYAGRRKNIFLHKLGLPVSVFKGAKLLEFGPDSGENSLVFAQWGALCTLCEPHLKAHPFIKEYFDRFKFSSSLIELKSNSIAGNNDDLASGAYDIIIAEGFIYTVKPDSIWMNLFSRLIAKDGLVVVNYMDTNGSFFEILLKIIHSAVKRGTGKDPLAAATLVFDAKWKSIPHTRSFESWIMDVLENPFMRLKYFIEPHALCQQMHDLGFTLYSALPCYKNGLAVEWVKKPWSAAEALSSQLKFITQSRLSHFFGHECFLIHPDEVLEQTMTALLTDTDNLLDNYDVAKVAKCSEYLAVIGERIGSNEVVIPNGQQQKLRASIESMQKVFELIKKDSTDELIKFCSTDSSFISDWGNITHYAVFSKQ